LITIPEPKVSPLSVGQTLICFRLLHIRRAGKYSCLNLSGKEKADLLVKLRYYQQMTVQQFKSSSSTRFKPFHKFPEKIPESLSEDIRDTLGYEFRTSQRGRCMGFLLDNQFHIIWVDKNHRAAG
jgi:hypothetical protein